MYDIKYCIIFAMVLLKREKVNFKEIILTFIEDVIKALEGISLLLL
jgi:hypothetical protein